MSRSAAMSPVDRMTAACARLLLAMHGQPKPAGMDLISDTINTLNELADSIWRERARVEKLEGQGHAAR